MKFIFNTGKIYQSFISHLSVILALLLYLYSLRALRELSRVKQLLPFFPNSVTPKNKKDFLDYIGRVRVIN